MECSSELNGHYSRAYRVSGSSLWPILHSLQAPMCITMRLRDRHAFYMHFLRPFDNCYAVGNIFLLDCHTKPTPTNSTLKWKYPVTILPFTQLASHPFFSIYSTTPVFSPNLKFLSGCVDVVPYTYSYSPRAAIS